MKYDSTFDRQYTISDFIDYLVPSEKREKEKYECPVCQDPSHNLSISKDGKYTCFTNDCDSKEIYIAAKKLAGLWKDHSDSNQSSNPRPVTPRLPEKTIHNYYKLNSPKLPSTLGRLMPTKASDAGLRPVSGRPIKSFKTKDGLDREFDRRFVYEFDADHVTERIEWADDSPKGYDKEVRPRNKEQDGKTWVAKKGEKFPPYKLDLIKSTLASNPNENYLLPIAEGEQNCELFRSIGILSTTAQAASWDDKTFKQLADAIKGYSVTLVVLVDSDGDNAGKSKAKKVCENAIKYGVPYIIVFYHDLALNIPFINSSLVPEHGDIKDCLKMWGKDDFLARLQDQVKSVYQESQLELAAPEVSALKTTTKKSLSPEDRDQELRLVFSQLKLNPDHHERLVNLGRTDDEIKSGWFRSLPRLCQLKRSVNPLTPGVVNGKFLPKYKGIIVPVSQNNLMVGFEILLDEPNRLGESQIISSQHNYSKLNGQFPVMIIPGSEDRINLVATDDAFASAQIIAKQTGYVTLGGDITRMVNQIITLKGHSKQLIRLYPSHDCFVNTKDKIFYKWQKLAHDLIRKGYEVQVAYWGQKEANVNLKDVDFSKIQYLSWEDFALKYSKGYAEYLQNKKFTPNKVVNQRYLNPEDCGFTIDQVVSNDRTISATRSDTGTGKTEAVATLVKISKAQGRGGIALHELNSVSLQSCRRLGFKHLNLGDNIELVFEDSSWVSLCINSAPKLYPDNFKGAIVIIDEAESVARALTNQGTLKGFARRKVQSMICELESSKMIVLMDANLSDKTVEFFASVAKIDQSNIIKIENQAKSEYGKVNIAIGKQYYESAIASAINQVVNLKLINQNSVIISDSQTLCEKLEMRLTSMGYGDGILRIDSKTKQGKDSKDLVHEFLEKPVGNEDGPGVLETHKPWLLIMSPTVKAGVSISKTQTWHIDDEMAKAINASGHYFSKGFFFRSFIDTDSAIQMLGRIRDNIDWDIWTEAYSRKDDDSQSTVMAAIEKHYQTLSAAHQAQLEENLSGEALAKIFSNFDQATLNSDPFYAHHIKQQQIINYDKTALAENLIREMKKQGREVEIVELTKQEFSLKDEGEEINAREAQKIFDADYMDIITARKVIQSWSASEVDMYRARKAIFLDMHPGLENSELWSVELIKRMMFKDKDISRQLYRRWLWLNPDKAKEIQLHKYRMIETSDAGTFLPDVDNDYVLNQALASNGFNTIMDSFLNGEEYTEADFNQFLKKMKANPELFGQVGKYALRFFNNKLKSFGLTSKKVGKEGTRIINDMYQGKSNPENLVEEIMKCFNRRFERLNEEQINQAQSQAVYAVEAEKDDPEICHKKDSSSLFYLKKYSSWVGKKVKYWVDETREWLVGTLIGQYGDDLWNIDVDNEMIPAELDLKGDGWVLA